MTSASPRTRRQWIAFGAVALAIATLCLVAGRWQWNRHVHREAQIAQIESRYDAAAVALTDVLNPDGALTPETEWQPVVVHGTYETAGTVFLRNRPINGQVGYHVLVPLRLSAGEAPSGAGDVLVVDRGFLPWQQGTPAPADAPMPPSGRVSAIVTMRPAEPASTRDAPERNVHAIDPDQVLAVGAVDGTPVLAYGQLRSEDPAAGEALRPLLRPDVDPGSHLSYALQWCVFALGTIGGFIVLVLRDRRGRTGRTLTAGDLLDADVVRPTRRKRPTAEEEEDALIDAQLAVGSGTARADGTRAHTTQASETSSR